MCFTLQQLYLYCKFSQLLSSQTAKERLKVQGHEDDYSPPIFDKYINLITIRLHYVLYIYSNCICTANSPGFRPRLKKGYRNIQGHGYCSQPIKPYYYYEVGGGGILIPLHRLVPSRFSTFRLPCTIQHKLRKKSTSRKKVSAGFFSLPRELLVNSFMLGLQ